MPRKTRRRPAQPARPHAASMRPRPDAAENYRLGFFGGPEEVSASMRPRPDAAENKTEALTAGR